MIPPVANRFVAGETQRNALDYASSLNKDGINVILNLLGEHYKEESSAVADTAAYTGLAPRLASRDIDGCISVKPSQIGLDISATLFEQNLLEIVDVASTHDVFVWVDMEDHSTTDVTLDAFEAATTTYGGQVGLCIQANLKRTEDDLRRLVSLPGKVRLVKGAYDEPSSVAYQDAERVDERYRDFLQYMFESFDDGIAVGSHDPAMIKYAQQLYDEYGTPFEFQMLMGVRSDEQHRLAEEGYEVYQYVPYGQKWLQYFYRRLRERKKNVLFAVRAIVSS